MLEVIERLLVLQDRDRKILQIHEELAHIPTERRQLQARNAEVHSALEAIKTSVKQIESDRKKLELEVEAKKQQIERYSLQQFQTKKNEEYRALAHEIDICKSAIAKLEDEQLELMEQAEVAQQRTAEIARSAQETEANVAGRLSDLAAREKSLEQELGRVEANRGELAAAVDEGVRARYERLFKHKGQNVVVGIHHGVCGGCHMQLSRQIVVSCQADQEVVNCPNCGRILYFTPDMDLAVAE